MSFSLPPWELLRAFLPTYHDPPFSEYVAYTGAAALMTAAIAAPWWGKRYTYNLTAYFAGLTVAGVVFALGRYLPIYELFYDHLPGFALFRVPARWLFLAAFGLAGLAGLGIDALAAGERLRVARAQLSNRLFTLAAGLLLMCGRRTRLPVGCTLHPAGAAAARRHALVGHSGRRRPADHRAGAFLCARQSRGRAAGAHPWR